jgi:Leucine-rich repeat (LRR) protein
MKVRSKKGYYIISGAIMGLWLLSACKSDKAAPSMAADIMKAEKPSIDTSKVLETLELYRAARYESLQAAMLAGAENVHKLVLWGRKMESLPPQIGELAYLATLDVAYNDLTVLPGEIEDLHYLQGFYANGNRLTEFPSQILLLPVLTRLDLSENQITQIPEEIMKMDQLTRLTLDKNAILQLPVQLYALENLEILELKGNGLSVIPEGISNLKNLKKLDLADNQLTTLPDEITAMAGHLKELNIQGNQIPGEKIESRSRIPRSFAAG